ncbi:putative peptidase_S74 domain-containing structural protein [Rhizobium phage RHph_I3_18]|nr:putative peptidase_S74 domain-containing structural protein [Rhizobium phage RHph_I3_18]
MVSTPKAPDPDKTAAAQTGMNRDTALTQQQINMVNQVTPDGKLTYNQTGTSSFVDSKGKTVTTPTYTAVTTLSPEQAAIKKKTDAASLNLGTIANERSAFLRDYLSKPFDVNAETEQKLYDLGRSRLDPRFEQQRDQLSTRLIASGIRPGTEAYDQQMGQFEQSRNDAYNNLALTGRQQAFNEASYERAQPLNEISALMSGSQVQTPQLINTPSANVGGVDYAGMVQNKYNAEVQASNAAMGGLFGLAAAGIKAIPWSDRRLKKDISQLGERKGLPWYSFRYIWEGNSTPAHEGFMADDVVKVMPEAVHTDPSGFHKVDYDLVLGA